MVEVEDAVCDLRKILSGIPVGSHHLFEMDSPKSTSSSFFFFLMLVFICRWIVDCLMAKKLQLDGFIPL